MGEIYTHLTFHGVGEPGRVLDPGEEEVWLSMDAFHHHLDAARDQSGVTITFDDGNSSDVECALPALLERGMHATFFVIVDRIDQPGSLSREDIHKLLENDMEIGSHGMAHRSWRQMSPDAMQQEIFVAKERLERIVDRPVTKAACPFGTYDRRSLRQLAKAGFEIVYTSDGGAAKPGQWVQARNTLHRSDPADMVACLLTNRAKSARSFVRWGKQLVKRWR